MRYLHRYSIQWIGSIALALVLSSGCILREAAPSVSLSPTATQLPATPVIVTPVTSSAMLTSEATTPTPILEATTPEPGIPLCEFAASAAPEATTSSSLDVLTFSEPRIALTHTAGIGIASWLPDSQRLLMTRDISEQRQYIEIYDVQTGKLQRYGERRSLRSKPIWLAADHAVAFTDMSSDKSIVLRVSYDPDTSAKDVVTGLETFYLASNPDGQQVIFFSKETKEHPQVFNVNQTQRQALSFALPSAIEVDDLYASGQMNGPAPYQADWHPGGKWIAFYNDIGLYLADMDSGQLCQVDLNQSGREVGVSGALWPFYTQWSPDGRYLAMITTAGDPVLKFSSLTILDTVTGELRSISPMKLANSEQNYITDIVWAPDSQVLVTWLVVEENEEGTHRKGIYLIDVATGQNKRMLPQTTFTGGDWGHDIALSPDGQYLMAYCPTKDEGRLCLITITGW